VTGSVAAQDVDRLGNGGHLGGAGTSTAQFRVGGHRANQPGMTDGGASPLSFGFFRSGQVAVRVSLFLAGWCKLVLTFKFEFG